MHLVTDAGREAQSKRDAAAEALSVRLLAFITDGPKTPAQMQAEFAATHGGTGLIQEAMWLLLDRSQAWITEDRCLTACRA